MNKADINPVVAELHHLHTIRQKSQQILMIEPP